VTSTLQRAVGILLDAVWSRGELSAADEVIADAYTIFHDPGDPWEGKTLDLAGYKARVEASRAPFPDQRFFVEAMLADDAQVMVTWRWRGTHRGAVAGIPATNRLIEMTGATLYPFKDGRVVGHWQVVDRLGVFQQLRG
jgi:steroid delta-isomerase-like uncharacterized protein